MVEIGLLISASVPFALIFILMVGFRWSALKTMPLAWIVTAVLAFLIWKLSVLWITAAFIKGIFVALEILVIVFGAIWLLEIFKESRYIESIQSFLARISPDSRVQAILIGFLFVALIEGVAGFGTPAALAAPLLVSLGFTPIGAVVISLIGDSIPVTFGAAGTPIVFGLRTLGFSPEILQEVTLNVGLMHSIAGLFIPLVMVLFVTNILADKKERSFLAFWEVSGFALFAGLVFVIPFYLIARFVGPELPSIFASLIGLLIVGFAAKKKFLVPKNIFVIHKQRHKEIQNYKNIGRKSIFIAVLPYVVLVLGLLLSRAVPAIREATHLFTLRWMSIFGLSIGYEVEPFFTPGFYFLIAVVVAILVFRVNSKQIKVSLRNTILKLEKPAIALIFTLALVQLIIVSGNGAFGLQSIPLVLADFLAELSGRFFIFVSPFIGMFGAFIAGSNTVSNLLFGSFQEGTALSIGVSVALILALQAVGGAIGNMFAIHNVLAAEATVKLHGKEGEIIRKTILVALGYALLVGLIAWLIMLFSW